jgi:hypothetical protein
VFDSEVLPETCEILGAPVVKLDVAVTEPTAMVAARLSDVGPDGRATRVTFGLLNLTHRESHAKPEMLEPGKRYRVYVRLNGVAQAFPPGHKIRLSLSTSYWPLAWPPPQPVRLSVFTGESALLLPVRPIAESDEAPLRPFEEPEATRPIATTQLRPSEQQWTVSRDLVDYQSALEVVKDGGVVLFDDIGLEVGRRTYQRYSWMADDFESAHGEVVGTMTFRRDGWSVRTVTRTILSCSQKDFHLHAQLDGYEGERRVFSKNWEQSIPRDHV